MPENCFRCGKVVENNKCTHCGLTQQKADLIDKLWPGNTRKWLDIRGFLKFIFHPILTLKLAFFGLKVMYYYGAEASGERVHGISTLDVPDDVRNFWYDNRMKMEGLGLMERSLNTCSCGGKYRHVTAPGTGFYFIECVKCHDVKPLDVV